MPSPTTPLSGRRLAELSTARLTVILAPPPSSKRKPCGALVLFPAEPAHLVKGAEPGPVGSSWWAVTWEIRGPSRLELVDPLTWRAVEGRGTPREIAPVNMAEIVRGRPQPVLEALAEAVRQELEIVAWRDTATGPEPRRLRACKIHPGRQVVVAEDLDRQDPRSFRLADLVAVNPTATTPSR